MNRYPKRDDLRVMSGYHSPQVSVKVRLNTNESPIEPPAEFVQDLADAVRNVRWNRYPDRAAHELRSAIAALHQVSPANVFVANGSNEVLQSVLLAYSGAGRTVATFEPTYQLHSHIARIAGATVVQGKRNADFTLSESEVQRVLVEHQPSVTFLCSPNNPTGMAEDPAIIVSTMNRAPVWWWSTGICTVLSVHGTAVGERRFTSCRQPHVLKDVVDGSGTPRVPRRTNVDDRRSGGGCTAVPP